MAHAQRLDALVDAIEAALGHGLSAMPGDCDAQLTARAALAALNERVAGEHPAPIRAEQPDVLRHLSTALGKASSYAPEVAEVASGVAALAGELDWKPRSYVDGESPRFREGHANTHIIGPLGLEKRSDVIVGLSLVAPRVEYPQHNHPPAELYIPLSEGEWYRESKQWYRPGPGGIVYHEPNIVHAMRAQAQPLLAMWILWVG